MVAAVILALATVGVGAIDSSNCKDRPEDVPVDPSPRHIWLQVVLATPATSEALETMFAVAAAIWRPYNISVSPVYTLSKPDDRRGQWITLVLRDQPANRIDGKAPRGHRALASLTFMGETPGKVMYASLDTAGHMVQSAGMFQAAPPIRDRFAAQLLGQAIAHELGHYLLRSRKHSNEGLMRASFGVADLLSRDIARFRLLPEQAGALTQPGSMRCFPKLPATHRERK